MNYQRTTFDNGLRLLTAAMPGMRSASIAFFFSVGSRYEPDALAGASHFIEHMLFKGSRHYPTARHISEAIEGVGGAFNGSTGKELTNYTARVPGEQLAGVLRVLADMVRYPRFDPVEIEKERDVIIEELSATRDDPQEWVNLLIDEVMWPNLPLGRDDAGFIDTVAKLERDQLLRYMHEHYGPNSLVISAAGNIDHDMVIHEVHQLFGNWEPCEHSKWHDSLPPRDAHPVAMLQRDTEQTNVCLATLGAAYTAEEYHPMTLINALLGDGMSSRLFQTLREEQGLAYDIGSYINSYYETGSLVISAGVDPSQTEPAIQAITSELSHLCETPVPADELNRTKAYVRGGIELGFEGTQQVASWLGSQECLRNTVIQPDEIIAQIDAVTTHDIQDIAQRCFAPEWRRLCMIGPDDSALTAHFEHIMKGT